MDCQSSRDREIRDPRVDEIPLEGHCQKCGQTYDDDWLPLGLKMRGLWDGRDLNGRSIVSQRFVDFCRDNGYADIDFPQVHADPNFYVLRPRNVLAIDVHTLPPEVENYCLKCANYSSRVMSSGVALAMRTARLADGFYRSDLGFGQSFEKQPLCIVAPPTKEKIIKAKLRGFSFDPVPFINKWHVPVHLQYEKSLEEIYKLKVENYAMGRALRAAGLPEPEIVPPTAPGGAIYGDPSPPSPVSSDPPTPASKSSPPASSRRSGRTSR